MRFLKWNGHFSAVKELRAVAGATPLGVKIGGLDGVRDGRKSKMGKLQASSHCIVSQNMIHYLVSKIDIRNWRDDGFL